MQITHHTSTCCPQHRYNTAKGVVQYNKGSSATGECQQISSVPSVLRTSSAIHCTITHYTFICCPQHRYNTVQLWQSSRTLGGSRATRECQQKEQISSGSSVFRTSSGRPRYTLSVSPCRTVQCLAQQCNGLHLQSTCILNTFFLVSPNTFRNRPCCTCK